MPTYYTNLENLQAACVGSHHPDGRIQSPSGNRLYDVPEPTRYGGSGTSKILRSEFDTVKYNVICAVWIRRQNNRIYETFRIRQVKLNRLVEAYWCAGGWEIPDMFGGVFTVGPTVPVS